MYQIRNWLCISGYPTASSPKMVKAEGVEAILQLFEGFEMDGVVTHFIPVNDGFPITKSMIQEGINFICKQRAAERKLLISCGAGISRSVTFSIIALMELEGLSMEEAYRAIHERHEKALPDHVHWQSLANFYDDDSDFWEIWGSLVMDDED
jgi:protein-tyrosine phosphatase